ncbi:hypothetical protein A2768_01515 [Candidatus Roizmanbacteria bacterium RIFCSPHIGHO2_01_FULL_37_16]|nr:MAG: hypothetical protein A2768_01515 [Candidatus Roizmanbacteria bacterium RIFCSPHIGHO2_01_FULL_37_16]
MLSKEAVIEYQQVYKKIYGKEISYEKALEQGTKLIELFKIINKPLKSSKKQNYVEYAKD